MHQKSLEDTIRMVSSKYKNRPPINLNPMTINPPVVPHQQSTPPTTDLKANLLNGFVPKPYTFS